MYTPYSSLLRWSFLSFLAIPTFSHSVSAQTAASRDSLFSEQALGGVVVTGTRTPKLLKNTPVQTRVITAEDIRRAAPADLPALLQEELPGVEFSFAMNQQPNLNLAGFAGQSVLILVDGERLAGETMDNVDFSRIDMNQVERIEIVRGAASALYGSNATGGVINIITRAPKASLDGSLSVRVGEHDSQRYAASLSCKNRRVANLFAASFAQSDSYNVCSDASDACDYRRVFGSRTWSVSDRLTYRPHQTLRLGANAGYYFRERFSSPDQPERYRSLSVGARGEWTPCERDRVEFSYAFDQYDKSDYYRALRADVRDYSNVQHSARVLWHHMFREHDVFTVGGGLTRDYLSSYQFEAGKTYHQWAYDVLAQYDWQFAPGWEAVGALRWDYFTEGHASQLTTRLNLRRRWHHWTFRGGYAGGFRAPTLKERYMKFDMSGIFDIHGNQDLRSERSHNLSLSADYGYQNYRLTLSGTYSRINNKITTSSVSYDESSRPFVRYINVDKLDVLGAEVTAQAHWRNGLSARLSYLYTHEMAPTGSLTPYCPARPHTLHAKFSWDKRWLPRYATQLTLSGRFLSAVDYTTAELVAPFAPRPVHSPAYTLWNVRLAQEVGKLLTVHLTVDNLFNYRPEVYSFNTPPTTGTHVALGAVLRF